MAVAAGLSATTLLTLVVIPVVYTLVAGHRAGSSSDKTEAGEQNLHEEKAHA